MEFGSQCNILWRRLPSCLELLHVQDVKPHLLSAKVITFNEYEELTIGPLLHTQRDLAEKLLLIMARKGPSCAAHLLQALERSVQGQSPQVSHYPLITMLKGDLEMARYSAPSGLQADSAEANGAIGGGLEGASNGTQGIMMNGRYDPLYTFPGASNEPVPLVQYDDIQKDTNPMLLVKLVTESRQIRDGFTTFVLKVASLLQSKSVNIDEVQLALESQLGSGKIDEHLQRKIDIASSIPALLRAAMPFSSWYNYDLIGYLAKHFGGEEGKALVCSYECQLKSHLLKRVIECPPLSSLLKVPNGFESISVKVDWEYKKCTIQDITIFKEKLCKLLNQQDPSVFILKSVEEGCVSMTWVVPATLAQQIHSSVAAAIAGLAAERILHLSVGRDVFIDQASPTHPRRTIHFTESVHTSMEDCPDQQQRQRSSLHDNTPTVMIWGSNGSAEETTLPTEKSQDEGVFDTPVTTLYSGPKFPPYRQNSAHKRRRNFAYQYSHGAGFETFALHRDISIASSGFSSCGSSLEQSSFEADYDITDYGEMKQPQNLRVEDDKDIN